MEGQKRFWNWQDEDSTFDLSRWLIGVLENGVYRGFDANVGTTVTFPESINGVVPEDPDPVVPDNPGGALLLVLYHTESGAFRTQMDRTISSPYGIIITKQGVIVQQDTAVSFTIEATGSSARTDLVVLEHEYKELSGGIDAVYKVIKGNNSGSAPALTNPNIQVPIGQLYLPANCSNLKMAGVKWTKSKTPNFANSADFIEKSNGFFLTNLAGNGNRIINLGNPINSQDASTKYYVDTRIVEALKMASETERGIIELANEAESLAGNDDLRAMTPFKTRRVIENRTANQTEANENTVGDKFITPKTLGNRFSTTARKGIIKLATEEEAADHANNETAITPYLLHKYTSAQQIIIEIGGWNIQDGTKTIPHSYDWWNKIVGTSYMIFRDDGVLTNGRTAAQIAVEVSSSQINLVPTDPSANGDYNSGLPNRGHLIFWIKNDIVSPPSSIHVSAGADQSGAYQDLSGVVWQLNGSVESIGSAVDTVTWSVVSKPAGAVTSFGNAGSEVTTFNTDQFGAYVLRLSGVNEANNSDEDDLSITITQLSNIAPTALARWSDNTSTPKTIAWQVYNPNTNTWYGYYTEIVTASASVDPDGQIVGHHWQFNYNNLGWQDMETNSATFPMAPSMSKQIMADGLWSYRVRVKDNLGAISAWSNEIGMEITGANPSVIPLDIFYLQITSTSGFDAQAQLTMSPLSRVARLDMSIVSSSGGQGPSTHLDIWYKVVGAGTKQGFAPGDGGINVDLTTIKAASMSFIVNIRNTPRLVDVRVEAFDSADNLIGTGYFLLGNT